LLHKGGLAAAAALAQLDQMGQHLHLVPEETVCRQALLAPLQPEAAAEEVAGTQITRPPQRVEVEAVDAARAIPFHLLLGMPTRAGEEVVEMQQQMAQRAAQA
jgi:hypothetical protein